MLLESKGNMEYERNIAREEMKKGNNKKLVSKEMEFLSKRKNDPLLMRKRVLRLSVKNKRGL